VTHRNVSPQGDERDEGHADEAPAFAYGTDMLRAVRVLERMVNQNSYDEFADDFKYWEDPSDQVCPTPLLASRSQPRWGVSAAAASGAVTQPQVSASQRSCACKCWGRGGQIDDAASYCCALGSP